MDKCIICKQTEHFTEMNAKRDKNAIWERKMYTYN